MGSTPAKGSSSRINFGSVAKHRAISVLRLSPPESKSPRFLRMCCSQNSSSRDSNFTFCSNLDKSVISRTANILSSTDNFLKTEASCAK